MLNLIIYQHNPNHIPVDHLANAKKIIFLKPVFFNVIFQPLNDTRTKMEISETIFQVMIFLLSKKLKEFENQVFLSEIKNVIYLFYPKDYQRIIETF